MGMQDVILWNYYRVLISNQLVCFVPINECLLSIVVYVRSCAVSFLHKIFFLNVFMEL